MLGEVGWVDVVYILSICKGPGYSTVGVRCGSEWSVDAESSDEAWIARQHYDETPRKSERPAAVSPQVKTPRARPAKSASDPRQVK